MLHLQGLDDEESVMVREYLGDLEEAILNGTYKMRWVSKQGTKIPCLGKADNLPTDETSQLKERGNLLWQKWKQE